MPFICCMEEEPFTSRLALIVRIRLVLADAPPATHSLEYMAF